MKHKHEWWRQDETHWICTKCPAMRTWDWIPGAKGKEGHYAFRYRYPRSLKKKGRDNG